MKKQIVCLVLFLTSLLAEQECEVVQPPSSWMRQVFQPMGMPFVSFIHSMKENVFLNYAHQDAQGFEALGDWLLTPYRYLMGGFEVRVKNSQYTLVPACNYREGSTVKGALCLLTLPFSTPAGSLMKGISYLSPQSRALYENFKDWKKSFHFVSHNSHYVKRGIEALFSQEVAPCLHLARPSQLSETHLLELEALKEICALFQQHALVYWLDCGSALGAYRYQGMIPWDDDIDLSIIADDHHNVRKLLETLDPDKYQIQDWSSYCYPHTFMKLYIKKTKTLIDIYHYTLDSQHQLATYFYTYKDTPLPKKWKRFEEVMTKPIPYAVIFPLKKAQFDGIEVWVPHDLEQFLHYKYGDNLSPTMIWDASSQVYLKVKNHPYWRLFE